MSDVVLDNDRQVTVLADNLNVQAHDLLLDSPERRTPNGPRFRRALVHDAGDSLTVNFGNDYPGGVTLNGVASITPKAQPRTGLIERPADLVVHGGITYEVAGIRLVGGGPTRVTVSVEEQFAELQRQVTELTARVARLEGH